MSLNETYEIMQADNLVALIGKDGRGIVYNYDLMPYNLYINSEEDFSVDVGINNLNNFYYWCSSRVLSLDRKYTFGINKDGGSVRTGARTPMLWTEERNGGFSLKRTTYLPITSQKGISVASQKENERSLLNSVKKLIKIRKEQECFNVGASQKFIETGYPVIYERGNGKKTAIVMINPSDKTFKRKVKYSEILIKENSEASGEEITLYPQSYTILLK